MRAALVQMAASMAPKQNLDRAEALTAEAAKRGATVVCLQELFPTWYFPQRMDEAARNLGEPLDGQSVTRMRAVARSLKVILIVPFYERTVSGDLYNTAVVVDAQGEILGIYRKVHIPEGKHGHEKFYFRPGDKGFPVFDTAEGKIGIQICFDRHYPEGARMLALAGAEVMFVPTASFTAARREVWELELRSHAIANGMFVAGVNRVGPEFEISFYGSSLFVDPRGQVLSRAGSAEEVLIADLDRSLIAETRKLWPYFRDRRPDTYGGLAAP